MSEDEKNRWNIIKPVVTTDERINDLKEKLKHDPKNKDCLRELAFLLCKQGRYEELIDYCKIIIDLGENQLVIEIFEFLISLIK